MELIPLSQIDAKDVVLSRYLAPPAAPVQLKVVPAREAAEREANGIGAATFAFFVLVLAIGLGRLEIALPIALILGVLARIAIQSLRAPAIRAQEQLLLRQGSEHQSVYEARRAIWDRLAYCPKHSCVLDAALGRSRPLHLAHELLVLHFPSSTTHR